MDGHVEKGGWIVDEGAAAGRFDTANAAVRAVHGGTSLNAWLYIVLAWEGSWKDANDIRNLDATRLNPIEENQFKWYVRELRTRPEAKGASEDRIMIAAARWAAKSSDD